MYHLCGQLASSHDTEKILLEAHALIEAHPLVRMPKMPPIFQANFQKHRASTKKTLFFTLLSFCPEILTIVSKL